MRLSTADESDALEQFRKWFQSAKDASKDWRGEAKTCRDFKAGNQWDQEDVALMEEELRNPVTFNRVDPLVEAVSGHQINNRQEVRYLPRQMGDVQVSEVLTGAGSWVEDEADTEDEEEEIFEDLLVTGMGWSEGRMDYSENPDGQLIPGEWFDCLEAYWDANSKRRNLADTKWRARGRWIDRSDAEMRWPKLKKWTFDTDAGEWQSDDESRDEPHNAARAHFYEKDARQWYNKHEDQVFILQFQWWEFEPIYRIGDPSGKILTLSENKFTKLKELYEKQGEEFTAPHIRQMKKKFFQAFIAGPTILERKPNIWDEGFTLQCVTGKRDAQKKMWYGIVRPLIEPQKWSNKFLSDLQDMIVSNRQGGAFAEESALVNVRKAEEDWNSNSLIVVRDGAISQNKILERTPPPMPPALDRMLEWCISAIPAVSGINQEFMGYAERDQANVLEVQRKRSAMNVLASLFSSLRKYRKDRARMMLALMREYLNDGRLIRIVGGDGQERYIPLALSEEAEDYDIVIDEASSSPNQRDETFSILMSLAPFLQQSQIPVPPDVVDYLPLPASLSSKWKELLSPKEPDPAAQKQAQIIEFAATAEAQKDQSDAEYKAAQARKAAAEAETQELINMAVKAGLVSVEDV